MNEYYPMNGKNIPMKIEVTAYQVIEKVVKAGSNSSGRVYVPKSWEGKRVKILLMEEPNEELE